MQTASWRPSSPVAERSYDEVMKLAISKQLVVLSTAQPGMVGRIVGTQINEVLDGKEILILQVEFIPNGE